MDEILHEIYYNPANQAGFSSVRKLYKEVQKNPQWKGTVKDVKLWLAKQPTYTRHRLGYVNFKRRRFITFGIDYCFQLDLADMRSLSRQNDGIKFLLIVIDTFSKYLWIKPLKTKNASDTVTAFKAILNESKRVPLSVFSDKGTEFVNKQFKDLMDSLGIVFYQAQDPDVKAGQAERVIRTIKGKLYKYMYSNSTSRYIDVLQNITHSYNNTKHRSIGMAPSQVTPDKEPEVFQHLYPDYHKEKEVKFAFKQGDEVKIQLERTPFTKGYTPQYSDETFIVTRVVRDDPPVYKLKSKLDGENILGSWYRNELVLTVPDKKL